MRYSQVKIGRTVSLGQFENFRLELTAEVEPSDDPADVVAAVTNEVEDISKELKSKWMQRPPPTVKNG